MPRRTLAGLALATLLAVGGPSPAQHPEYPPQPAPQYVPMPYAYPFYVYVPYTPPLPYRMLAPLRYEREPLDLSPVPVGTVAAAPRVIYHQPAYQQPVYHQSGYRGPRQEQPQEEQPRLFSKKVGGFIFK
jgi:hypothetical protein